MTIRIINIINNNNNTKKYLKVYDDIVIIYKNIRETEFRIYYYIYIQQEYFDDGSWYTENNNVKKLAVGCVL